MLSYRIRDRTARWKAIAACTVTWQVQSAAYQKLTAKKKSFVKPGRLTNRLRSRPSSTPSPTSTSLLVFLWPQPPPLEGAQRPTDLCLSVVHAFISDHTRRFRPEIHGDENACGCGILIVFSPTSHTDAHVMYKLEDAPATVTETGGNTHPTASLPGQRGSLSASFHTHVRLFQASNTAVSSGMTT